MKYLKLYDGQIKDLAEWYVRAHTDKREVDLTKLRKFQGHLGFTAGIVMTNILQPAWKLEADSLICQCAGPDGKPTTEDHGGVAIPSEKIPRHVRAAEEFFVLPYLAFIQNVLGRIRTIAWGIIWLFLSATFAVSSYPFDPLPVLGAIFLSVFIVVGGLMCVVYSQMSRDATLSHLTDTRPGELGWDFWVRILTFGFGPLIGLLTTLFPSITDFVFSWLQPNMQSLK